MENALLRKERRRTLPARQINTPGGWTGGVRLGNIIQTNGRERESNQVQDGLEAVVREGARRMLAAALEEEVSGF